MVEKHRQQEKQGDYHNCTMQRYTDMLFACNCYPPLINLPGLTIIGTLGRVSTSLSMPTERAASKKNVFF